MVVGAIVEKPSIASFVMLRDPNFEPTNTLMQAVAVAATNPIANLQLYPSAPHPSHAHHAHPHHAEFRISLPHPAPPLLSYAAILT